MMISLQLKGAQLSCVLAEMTILIVSYGGGNLKFQIIITNGKLSSKLLASTTLEDPLLKFDLLICLPVSRHWVFRRQQASLDATGLM